VRILFQCFSSQNPPRKILFFIAGGQAKYDE
jgi:hypothetical protein